MADKFQQLDREALSIILPNLNYDLALVYSSLQTLLERRGQACERFIQALSVSRSPCLLPQRISVNHGYDLRSGTTRHQHANTNRLLGTDRFITFKYT